MNVKYPIRKSILTTLAATSMGSVAFAEIASPEEVKAAEAANAQAESDVPAYAEPFAFADFTWLNGNSRQKTSVLDSKYFTGQFLADVNYIADFNQPKDHTLVGSTSAGHTNEFQVQQLGIGGDFHAGHARGQWELNTAYRYISEAYGDYHYHVNL